MVLLLGLGNGNCFLVVGENVPFTLLYETVSCKFPSHV